MKKCAKKKPKDIKNFAINEDRQSGISIFLSILLATQMPQNLPRPEKNAIGTGKNGVSAELTTSAGKNGVSTELIAGTAAVVSVEEHVVDVAHFFHNLVYNIRFSPKLFVTDIETGVVLVVGTGAGGGVDSMIQWPQTQNSLSDSDKSIWQKSTSWICNCISLALAINVSSP